jgi:tRNA pseudouridine55 synthase
MLLGKSSDTFDSTGNILAERNVDVSIEKVKSMAQEFQGEFEFPVPLFSAVKVDGQKLYEYARRREEVQIPRKIMKFWKVEFLQESHPQWEFAISCSKGSYIRTWIHELGGKLECGAVMSGLTRTYSAPYNLVNAQSIQQVQEQVRLGQTPTSFVPISEALPHILKIRVGSLDSKLLMNGQIGHEFRTRLIQKFDPEKSDIVQAMSEDGERLMALIGFDKVKGFVIRRVINQF